MTLKKKLVVAGVVLGVPLVALGLVRILTGHDDPITIENPKVVVDFGIFGHPMKVKRDTSDSRAVEMSRDMTNLESVTVYFRHGPPRPGDIDLAKPIVLEDVNMGLITTSTKRGIRYNQFVVTVHKQFGECRYASVFRNQCGASASDLRLRTVRYTDTNGNPKHLCLNAGEDMSSATQECVPDERKAGVHFIMTHE